MKTFNLLLLLLLSALHQLGFAEADASQPIAITRNQPLNLTPAELVWIKQHPSVKVAVRAGWMPIEYRLEGESYRGVSLDYLKEISRLTGLQFQLTEYRDNLDATKVDLISSVTERFSASQFTKTNQPYLVIPYALYVNKTASQQVQLALTGDLSDTKVAIYKNAALAEKLKNAYPKIDLMYVDIADEAFDYLQQNRVDAYLGNELVIDYHIEFHRLNFTQKSTVTNFHSEIRMAVRNDEVALLSIIEKALKHIGTNNVTILNNWKTPKQSIHPLITVLLAVLLLTLMVVSYWLLSLRRKTRIEALANQKKIWHQANYDLHTNLPNRHFFETNINEVIQHAEKSQLQFALLFIDLDDFKTINDTSGHTTGDALLKQVGERLCQCIRATDFVARLGGDEFVVVINEVDDFGVVDEICEHILQDMLRQFSINQLDFYISASIGVSKYPHDSTRPEELLSFADQAMYEAKRLGRNRYVYFSETMLKNLNNKLNISNDLRVALTTNQFEMVYQPIMHVNTKRNAKAEALIRWHHPEKGLISPDQFIAIAEEAGLIHQLGGWIFKRVVQDMLVLRKALQNTNHSLMIGINISPLQFTQPQYFDDFMADLKQHDLSPAQVCFEITEGLLLDPSQTVIDAIKKLKAEGVKFAIDDFGTGYSALAYLKKFDIDFVKIDKSFIKDLDTNHYNRILCESIILMSHKLNIKLIAEGVEYLNQEEILKSLDCDYIQGYLHGRPMQLSDLIAQEVATNIS